MEARVSQPLIVTPDGNDHDLSHAHPRKSNTSDQVTDRAALRSTSEVVQLLAQRDVHGEVLTAIRHFPARPAQWAHFPTWVDEALVAAYAAKGIRQLYTHQTAAAEAVHSGKNVVI